VIAVEEAVNALGAGAGVFRAAVLVPAEGLLMTPRRTGTDGFFVALIGRR
jgi:16S rRNA (cytosine967-C5)-methyltransferase